MMSYRATTLAALAAMLLVAACARSGPVPSGRVAADGPQGGGVLKHAGIQDEVTINGSVTVSAGF